MTSEHDALRERLGTVGAWTFAFDARPAEEVRSDVGELEGLGYAAIWVPEGSSSRDVFAHLSLLLSATSRMTVASGIANITARQPEVMAQGGRTPRRRVWGPPGAGDRRRARVLDRSPRDRVGPAARTDARVPRADGRGAVGMDPPDARTASPRRARRRDAAAVGRTGARRALLLRAGRAHGARACGARTRAGAGRRAHGGARHGAGPCPGGRPRLGGALPRAAELREEPASSRVRGA